MITIKQYRTKRLPEELTNPATAFQIHQVVLDSNSTQSLQTGSCIEVVYENKTATKKHTIGDKSMENASGAG